MKSIRVLMAALFATAGVNAADLTDNDGDGLPDKWETHFGLSTNSAIGINGAYGDPDNDGLPNLAEYRAGYYEISGSVYSNFTLAVVGLNPTNAYSVNAVFGDYHHRPAGSLVTLGWMFTDADRIIDTWEDIETNGCSRFIYNGPNLRPDGWREWDSFQRSYLEIKKPTITLEMSYFGTAADGLVTVAGYTDITQVPDVTYTVPSMNGIFTVTNPTTGKLKSTTLYWTALKGTTWSSGTPFAFYHPAQDYEFGAEKEYTFGAAGLTCRFHLTDYAASAAGAATSIIGKYGRFAFPNTGSVDGKQRVVIFRRSVDANSAYADIVFNSLINSSQSFLHEGHLYAMGDIETDWGLLNVPTAMDRLTFGMELSVGYAGPNGTPVLLFTNKFDNTRSKAVLVSPVGGSLIKTRRPVFRWSMPENYSAFTLDIHKVDSTGPVVYNSGVLRRPPSEVDGTCAFSLPFYQTRAVNGQLFESGHNYYWRVSALNAKFSDATVSPNWSDWGLFRLDHTNALLQSNLRDVPVTVKYFGPALEAVENGITVQLYDNLTFSGRPVAEVIVAAAAAASVTDDTTVVTNTLVDAVPPGNYCVRAFIDHNANGRLDTWESWGYSGKLLARLSGASGNPPSFIVVIGDADTDNDGFSDAWEFEQNPTEYDFLARTGPSPTGRVNPTHSP